MRIEDESATRDVINRLSRARGQIDGVIAMIEQGRSCRDVVTQLSAASRAVDRASYKLVAAGLRQCLSDEQAGQGGSTDSMTQEELEKLFMSLA